MPAPLLLRITGPHARQERGALAISAVSRTAAVGLELLRPWPLAIAVDGALAGHGWGSLSPGGLLIAAGAGVVVITAAASGCDLVADVSAERAAERVGARLRTEVFEKCLRLSLRWHDRNRAGELVSRLSTDVGRVLDALVAVTTTFLPDLVRLTVVVVLLAVFDPALAGVALAVVPLLAVFAVRQRRRVREAQQGARRSAGRLAALVTDIVRNVRAVQAFDHAGRTSSDFGASNRDVLSANVRAVSVEARWSPIADLVLAIGSGLVLVVGGQAVLGGRMSTGDLLVVVAYLSALYSPVRSLSRLSGTLAKSHASAERLDDILCCGELVRELPRARFAPWGTTGVSFDHVTFGYAGDHPVLEDFTLDVRAGETLCLLGPSGVGKSTVLHLLLRLYDVDAGAIRLDGADLRGLTLISLRSRMAFVPQDPWLFDDTLLGNIRYGAAYSDERRLMAAAELAGVGEFAHRLPLGYHSPVGEAGVLLSGGQRRRVALARAVAANAPVLLLDEPTASLDDASAHQVIEAVRRSTFGRTAIIVTHDQRLAAIASRVIEMSPPDRQSPPVFVPSLEREVTTMIPNARISAPVTHHGRVPQPLAQPVPEPLARLRCQVTERSAQRSPPARRIAAGGRRDRHVA